MLAGARRSALGNVCQRGAALYPNSPRHFGKGSLTSQRRVVGWRRIGGGRMGGGCFRRGSSRERLLGGVGRGAWWGRGEVSGVGVSFKKRRKERRGPLLRTAA